MQTLTVHIQDSFLQEFLNIIEHYKGKIELQKDRNLEHDPYFYQRQKELHQDLKEIESGEAQMIEHDEFWANIFLTKTNHLRSEHERKSPRTHP
ncbi:MAG: hypothetical protein JXQ76_09005 [Campylobacterales bacterium]|nr:hypothetical protein [Campylobacterales bacterium]